MPAAIKIRPNGPYRVSEVVDLVDAQGRQIPHEAEFVLCRCGGSKNKPFCDSSHKTNGFSGDRISDGSKDRVKSYQAGGVIIRDNRSICAHAGRCTEGLATVFKSQARPWIDPGGGTAEQIAKVVASCPSGALSCSIEGAPPAPERPARIVVSKDGPYEVQGPVELVEGPWAQGADPQRYTLCRCGASKNKPFCDGSHWDAGFKDPA